uniref:Homeobox domain-containing protein n=1 Tax=Panagrellus redivivus TaxID=6233 RepID=A0A7E4V4Q0_PANRE
MPNGPPRLTDTRRNIGYGCRSKKEQQQQQQRSNTVSGSAKWWKWMMGSSKLANDCETYDTWTDEEDLNDSRCENRRNRTAFTAEQIKTLEKRFMENMYPSEDDKKDIITATGLDLNRINTWFSNRRARVRKQVNFNPDNHANVPPVLPPMPQGVWLPQPGPGFPMLPGTMGGSPPLPFVMPPFSFLNLLMMQKSFDASSLGFPGFDSK